MPNEADEIEPEEIEDEVLQELEALKRQRIIDKATVDMILKPEIKGNE